MAWDESGNWHEEKEREQAAPDLAPLVEAFRDQLLACLEECARGRLGLFSDREHLDPDAYSESSRPWPEAAQLRQLAFALQAILAQQEQSDTLCDQFLDLCSIHGESDPGEPRLARAFLNEIQAGPRMIILHAFLALLAGFVSMTVLVLVATAVLTKFVSSWAGEPGQPRAGYVFVNLGYSLAAAMVGGYVTASISAANPLIHVLALALIVLLMSALSALQQKGQQPIWYQLALTAIAPVGVFLGGLARTKIMGI